MTDQNDDGIDWGEVTPPSPESVATWTPDDGQQGQKAPARPAVSYPEHGPLPESPVSINFKVTGEPMITVRGYSGADITALLQDLADNGVWANIAAAQADLRTQGQIGGVLGPVSVPPAQVPGGFPQQSPGAPPFGPNVSAPSAPGFVGQPSIQLQQPQQQWGGQPGGFGGGGQNQSQRAEPAAQPPGWYRVNGRSGPGFDAWKAWREQNKDNLKGKIRWGGKSDYWIEPSLGQMVASMGYAVTP